MSPSTVSAQERHSIRALAARENVHPNTVNRWTTIGIHGHRLAIQRIGGRVFVREVDWLEFVSKLNSSEGGVQ
jgi:hypothetical protein